MQSLLAQIDFSCHPIPLIYFALALLIKHLTEGNNCRRWPKRHPASWVQTAPGFRHLPTYSSAHLPPLLLLLLLHSAIIVIKSMNDSCECALCLLALATLVVVAASTAVLLLLSLTCCCCCRCCCCCINAKSVYLVQMEKRSRQPTLGQVQENANSGSKRWQRGVEGCRGEADRARKSWRGEKGGSGEPLLRLATKSASPAARR